MSSKGPMPFGRQSGEGAALPAALGLTVKAREGGVARPAGAAEDTARQDDDARPARRLAIDRQTQGCVADKGKGKHRRGGGERGRSRRRSPGTATAHHGPRPRAGRVCPTAHRPRWPIAIRHSPPAIRHQRIAKAAKSRSAFRVTRFAWIASRRFARSMLSRSAPCACVSGPARQGRDRRGRARRTGVRGDYRGMARDETFSRAPQPRVSTRPARVEAMRPEPGARPEGRRP